MRANVLKQYPGLGMEFTLNDPIATYFPAPPAPASRPRQGERRGEPVAGVDELQRRDLAARSEAHRAPRADSDRTGADPSCISVVPIPRIRTTHGSIRGPEGDNTPVTPIARACVLAIVALSSNVRRQPRTTRSPPNSTLRSR